MAASGDVRSEGVGARILVVEDERIVALDLGATLRELGYQVVGSVVTGEDAIAAARELAPELVLMDIRLGGALDGIEAAALIQRERDLPIIYLTAHTDGETLRRAKQTAPMAYLVKPFHAPDLHCAIDIALHRHAINARLRIREEQLTETLRSIGALVTGGAVVDSPRSTPPPARVEELLAANRELEAFSASVAHDLRAPLHWIDGFSQVLVEDHAANLGAAGLGHLQRIRGAVAGMNQRIEDLLRLARVAHAEVDRRPVDLAQLARAVLTELGNADRDRHVELVVPAALVVATDEKLMRVALCNLLSNAWKFTSKCAAPRIELGHAIVDGVDTCFVRDNGAGFDMAEAHRLFNVFQRLHSASEFDGTGLGLAIAQRAIERVGGRIWADAAVDRGATFYFTVGV